MNKFRIYRSHSNKLDLERC